MQIGSARSLPVVISVATEYIESTQYVTGDQYLRWKQGLFGEEHGGRFRPGEP